MARPGMQPGTEAAGDGRLPGDWKKSLLWLVLALGAGGVMLMVYSLLKKPTAR